MALELKAEKITFGAALLLACIHAVLGWNRDSLAVLAGAIFFLLVGLKQAYLILTSVLPEQEFSEMRIRRWKFALGWVLLMAGILLVAVWEMSCCALEQRMQADRFNPVFWPGLAILCGTLVVQGAIFAMKQRRPGQRFLSRWMAMAPAVSVLGMAGFWSGIPPWGEMVSVWINGLISLVGLVLLVRECLTHTFRSIRSALLLES